MIRIDAVWLPTEPIDMGAGTDCGAVLVFDEVIPGFRLTYGLASNLLGVTPDIAVFGKIIGGGTPVGEFSGRRDLTRLLDLKQMLQGGTFAGNPLTMAAGPETLKALARPGFYEDLERKGRLLENLVVAERQRLRLQFEFSRIGSIFAFALVLEGSSLRALTDVDHEPREAYASFYCVLRAKGFRLCPDVLEPM